MLSSSYLLSLVAAMAATTIGQSTDGYAQTNPAVTTTPTPTPTPTPSASRTSTSWSSTGPATVVIQVGREGHLFTPREATAKVGDVIKFNFYPGGHRVARAAFGWPCIPYEYVHENEGGFYTGVFNPQAILNPPPSYEVRVNDTEPIFFYCAAPASCTDWQMVGVINPNATFTLDAQVAAAKKALYQLEPGEPFPIETSKPRPSNTGSPSTGGPAPNNSNNSDPNSSTGSSSLGAGAIAGIAIGAAAVVLIAGALLYLCGRRGGFDKAYRKSAQAFGSGSGAPPLPAMVEAGYPKSPGQSTLSAFHGSNGQYPPPPRDPFFKHGMSPVVAGYSPQQPGFVTHHHTGYSDVHSQGYSQSGHASPKPEHQFYPPQAPAELPDSASPQYAPNTNLWAQGNEGGQQPSPRP